MTPFLPMAITLQIGALLCFVGHLLTRTKSETASDYPKVGQCWEEIMEMGTHRSLISHKYVVGIKDGYVQFEERPMVEAPGGSLRVSSVDQFVFRSRLIKEDPNPFVTAEQKAEK